MLAIHISNAFSGCFCDTERDANALIDTFNPFTTIGIMCPTDFQKILLVILFVVIAWDSIPTVYYAPAYRFWWYLATFRTTTTQCTVERQGSLCAAIYYDRIPMGRKIPRPVKPTYPMGVEIFSLIFLICWTYEQAI